MVENQDFSSQQAPQEAFPAQEEQLSDEQMQQVQPETTPPPVDYRSLPEETLIEWKAPSRPFKKRNRQYYTTIAIIVLLISLILLFAGQFLPIAVVVAIGFLSYVLSAVPPGIVTNRMTTYGIRSEDTLYYWEEATRFWYSEKFGQRLVHIEVTRFPNQITLLLDQENAELVHELLSSILINQQPPPTAYDKAAKWLEEKIPLETEA